jgi:hypothetical protein
VAEKRGPQQLSLRHAISWTSSSMINGRSSRPVQPSSDNVMAKCAQLPSTGVMEDNHTTSSRSVHCTVQQRLEYVTVLCTIPCFRQSNHLRYPTTITSRQGSPVSSLTESTKLLQRTIAKIVALACPVGAWCFLGHQPQRHLRCKLNFRERAMHPCSQNAALTTDELWCPQKSRIDTPLACYTSEPKHWQ